MTDHNERLIEDLRETADAIEKKFALGKGDARRIHDAAAALEAKAQPTREELIEAMIGVRSVDMPSMVIFGDNPEDRADAGAVADAVLALLDDPRKREEEPPVTVILDESVDGWEGWVEQ